MILWKQTGLKIEICIGDSEDETGNPNYAPIAHNRFLTGGCEKMEQQNSEKIRRQTAHILHSKCVGETAGRRGDNIIRYDTIQYNTIQW